MKRAARWLSIASLVLVVSQAASCDFLLGQGSIPAPSVALQGGQAVLVEPPALWDLALYLCGRLLNPLACSVLGGVPSPDRLQFRFQLVFDLGNTANVPIPTTDFLVGISLFPGQTYGNLGSVCTTLCQAGSPDCPVQPSQACVDRAGDIDTMDEFLAATIKGGLALAAEAMNGEPVGQDLARYTIPAGAHLQLKVTFGIGIDPMLRLIEAAGGDVLKQVLAGSGSRLDIPYAVAGRLWFSIPYLGRIGVSVGPFGQPPDAPLMWNVM